MIFPCTTNSPATPDADPFVPYLHSPPPRVLREVATPGEANIPPDMNLRGLVFESLAVPSPVGLRTNEVFAVIAKPAGIGTYPGLLLLHGGKGQADPAGAVAWAKRGYVVIAPDLPGIADPASTVHFASASNDTFFWPPAVRDTLANIPGRKNQLIAPNGDHHLPVPGGDAQDGIAPAMAMAFFDGELKNQGTLLPTIQMAPSPVSGGAGAWKIRFLVHSQRPIRESQVWYSSGGRSWQHRRWMAVSAVPFGDSYEAELPADTVGVDDFALVSDDRPVSVSSTLLHMDGAR